MTTQHKAIKQQQQLPPIEKKQSNYSSNDQQTSPNDQNNVLPLTHQKKKRKHRKKLRKHSPQHYEEIRIKKINRKLQQKWDSHFINDQIPDLFEKKKVNRKTLSKLGNIINEKRSSTALNSRIPQNKVNGNELKKQTMPLPKINKSNKSKSKSFNIHVVAHKQSEPVPNKKKQEPTTQTNKKHSGTGQKRSRRPSHQQKSDVEQQLDVQQYKKILNVLFQQKKFLHCHKQALELFFEKLNKKSVRQIIDKEFDMLRKNESVINKTMQAIKNRQNFIDAINSLLDKTYEDKQILQSIDNYRTSTLAVVEEILKWKETWQTAYLEHFKKPIILELVYKTHNYLYTLASSADETINKFHQKRENKQKQNQKIEIQKEKLKTVEVKPLQIQKTQQKKQQKKQETMRQQIEITKRETQEKIGQEIAETKRYGNEKNKTESKDEVKPKQSEKIHNQQKTQKVLKTQEISHNKVKTQEKKKQHILLNDPFLISLFAIDKEDKNIILKIRACELLLIQQQFNFLKK